ncbi:MAG: cellulase family glycosylhydrolase [Bacteroidota bacterium]
MKMAMRCIALLGLIFTGMANFAQKNVKANNLVYVDKQGMLRYSKTNAEAAFFGVNYTTPFAHAFRAHKALGLDLEKAIQNDVYHMARLGFDAFRVHVWDTEITDTIGNLLENEHLRLFDFLLAELKKRNIKTIITPIAFWGNGYPERDENTPGFARKYGKGGSTANDTAIKAQENYLLQFFKHINPYTKQTYIQDADVIAVELNNEPSHSGPKQGVTDYNNRLAAAMRNTGWTKPLYYNIAQSPFYGDAVAKANVDGVSFQWYPSGLVANQEVQGNFLPHVDRYSIPFDTIPEYRTKSRMVYEFDAADILQSYMYPAIARSFRGAGFQWATQFAYDPMALAYANTEYQTHYLNLAYTPSKAISMLIASEVFHKVPRLKTYGNYPADSSFDAFRVSYRNSLSEMNTEQKFYYSNNTNSKPVSSPKLNAIAGVGSSSIVTYTGSGAYFLDKIGDGIWRLELMPDAIFIRDPFERASPKKEVTRIEWRTNAMKIMLEDLGGGFTIKGLNEGNQFAATANADSFKIAPGTYLLTRTGKALETGKKTISAIGLNEFVAPANVSGEMYVRHQPYADVTAGQPFTVRAKIVGLDTGRASLQISRFGGGGLGPGGGGGQRPIPMVRQPGGDYTAEVPANLVVPGMLTYKIVLQKGPDFVSFPGNIKGNPFAWDNYQNETWKTFVAAENGRLNIYDPTVDRSAQTFSAMRRGFQSSYITGEKQGQLIFRLAATELSGDHIMAFQYFFGDKLAARQVSTSAFTKLVIRARTAETTPVTAKIVLTDADAMSVSTSITLTNSFQDIEVPLDKLVPDSMLLLPRPYPGFMALKFSGGSKTGVFKLSSAEKIEIRIGEEVLPADFKKPYSIELESIWLKKN